MGAPVVALARLSLSCAAAVLLCVCAPWQRALPCMAFLCPPALALPPAPAAAPRRSTPNPVSERPLVQRWPRTGRKTLPARTPQTSDTALTAVGEDTTEGAPAAATRSMRARFSSSEDANVDGEARWTFSPTSIPHDRIARDMALASSTWTLSSLKEARAYSLVGLCEKPANIPFASSVSFPSDPFICLSGPIP
jgi:hypothetical protein